MPDVPQFVIDRLGAKSPIFTADEVQFWPTGLLDRLLTDDIIRPADNARSVACTACANDHVEPITYLESPNAGAPRAFIMCPDAGRVSVPFERIKQWGVNRQRLVELGHVNSTEISGQQPFGIEARRAHLSLAEQQLDREAYELLLEAEADQRQRGLAAVGFHPVCVDVVRAAGKLVQAALQFDEEAVEYELRRMEVHGDCENPFSETREAMSFDHVARRVDGTAGWIRSLPAGKRLWSVLDPQHWEDLCRIEKADIRKRVKLEYGKRRAQFALEIQARRFAGGSTVAGAVPSRSLYVPRKGKGVGKVSTRSWTQTDLDDAIRQYKAQRANSFSDLVDAVRRGKPGAKKAARQTYGRNAIARALGVKSHAMVTKSPAWQSIADDLRLREVTRGSGRTTGKRVGLEIALEEKAVEAYPGSLEIAVSAETVSLIRKVMPELAAETTIEKLERGEITDEQARELIDAVAEQHADSKTRQVRQKK